jgi:predicted nucleic acid-binding protein
MSMTSNIFIDNSVLIETYKGNKIKFYKSLFSNIDNQFFINDIVLSEYLYFTGFHSSVSRRTMQQRKAIDSTINSEMEQINILQQFAFLPGNQGFLSEVPGLMAKYNLLPYDVTILATCKLHGTKLASHDSEFIFPFEEENIHANS